MPVPRELRHAESAAGVAGRGLDPDLLERAFAKQSSVADAIERDAARQAQPVEARLTMRGARHAEHDLLAHLLDRPGEIHLSLRQLCLGLPRRRAEQTVERAVRHRETGQIVEVLLIERERAVFLQVHQLPVDQIHVLRLAVRGETHDLVLARVDLEAGVVREGRVEETERVGPVDLLEDLDIVAPADADRGRGPLADAVHRQERRFLERRRKERARRVRLVVLGIQQSPWGRRWGRLGEGGPALAASTSEGPAADGKPGAPPIPEMGREGIEPSTLGLRVPCSTS